MIDRDTILKLWDTAVWEFSLVFENLDDADVWRSPAPGVPSVGVQACHLAYAESDSFGGFIQSPLAIKSARYWPYGDGSDSPTHLTAAEVFAEYDRVHKEAVAWIRAKGMAMTDPYDATIPMHEGMTWGDRIEYMPLHVAYHTGQAYMARHIMGHETTDN